MSFENQIPKSRNPTVKFEMGSKMKNQGLRVRQSMGETANMI